MATLSAVTSALERCWSVIRNVHPEVRPAVMCVYLHPAGDRLGHYWQASWTTRDNRLVDEVHISSATLELGAEATFTTLLHEAVHSSAVTQSINEVSRQQRYHNQKFRKLALEFGLVVEKVPQFGYTTPDTTAETKMQYFNAILDLHESIELWQHRRPPEEGNGETKGSRNLKAVCPMCSRIIRLSMKTWNLGAIRCVPCGVEFELV